VNKQISKLNVKKATVYKEEWLSQTEMT
jgi:hypothetical protein